MLYFFKFKTKTVMELYSDSLLQDFINYGKTAKAKMVYNKCMKHGKTKLADKIAKKYCLNISNDLEVAFSYALRSINIK